MRVLSFPVTRRVDPRAAFVQVYGGDEFAVWLDSGPHAVSGMSVMGAAARTLTASVADASVTVDGTRHGGTVFDFLRSDLEGRAVPERAGFALGWVGWLGYELRAQTLQIQPSRQSRYPDAALMFLDRAIVFDHDAGTAELLALGESWDGELLEWRDNTLQRLADLTSRTEEGFRGPGSPRGEPIHVEWADSDEHYLDMIRDCQAAIAAGDAYQLCLTTEARVSVSPDPLRTYLALRDSSPTHHGAFVRMGPVSVLSASPEQFIAVTPS